MRWEDYKEAMRDEWEFYKRNPSFPIVMLLAIGSIIYSLCQSE